MNSPKKTRWFLLILGLGLLFVIGWFLFGPSREPSYDGKSLSYWFFEYNQRGLADPEINMAFEQLGTNALHWLLKQALSDYPESATREAYYKCLEELPEEWHLPKYRSNEQIADGAAQLIANLKLPAALLLPLLQQTLTQTNVGPYRRAIYILSQAREDSEDLAPYFGKALHSSDSSTRFSTINALARLGPKAKPAIPDIMDFLKRTPSTNGAFLDAVFILGNFGTNVLPAVPLIKNAYNQETNWLLRMSWAAALCRLDPSQTNALDDLLKSLAHYKTPGEFRWAISRLGFVGPNAKAAIPALLEIASGTNVELWIPALASLKRIEAPSELVLPKLRAKLNADEDFPYLAATRILEIIPTDAEAQNRLLHLIQTNSKECWSAIYYLGRAGTNAQAAIPGLIDVFNGTNFAIWRTTVNTLTNIGAAKDLFLPKLKSKLLSQELSIRFGAAGAILDVDPFDQQAKSVLVDLIKTKSPHISGAIYIFGHAGPAAKDTIPVLQEALESPDKDVHRAASWALVKVRGPRTSH